jgi:hypothetical protein
MCNTAETTMGSASSFLPPALCAGIFMPVDSSIHKVSYVQTLIPDDYRPLHCCLVMFLAERKSLLFFIIHARVYFVAGFSWLKNRAPSF